MPQPTCAERIDEQLAGRLQGLEDLYTVIDADDQEDIPADVLRRLDLGDGDLRELAEDRIRELPLDVELSETTVNGRRSSRTIKVLLSTGGPADWFEGAVEDDGNVSNMAYHFQDWHDHETLWVLHPNVRRFLQEFILE